MTDHTFLSEVAVASDKTTMRFGNDDGRSIWTLAEERAERSMRELEVQTNGYQAAEEAGERHERSTRAEIASAGDLCGG
jgi:hypothetical protein